MSSRGIYYPKKLEPTFARFTQASYKPNLVPTREAQHKTPANPTHRPTPGATMFAHLLRLYRAHRAEGTRITTLVTTAISDAREFGIRTTLRDIYRNLP